MKISIFGLGYVGSVTAGCLTEKGHMIVGVDPIEGKVKAFNEGKSPIIEPELDGLLKNAVKNKLLSATSDVKEAVSSTDLSIVCVGTPSLENGRLNLNYVQTVAQQIADALRESGKSHRLIMRSTMLPGSTRTIIGKYLQEFVDAGKLNVFYCPEFLREGTAVADFREPSLKVMGTDSGETLNDEEAEALLGEAPELLTWEGAELIKYACNYFHAVKISFANEIGRIAKTIGADAMRVMDVVCKDTRLNISTYYMKPGNPFGGSCLPKDVKALSSFARQQGINLPILDNTIATNESHLDFLLRMVAKTGKKNVTILGIAFKPDTDDLRESSMVAVAESLLGRGYNIKIYDPQINMAELVGSNERLISRRMPHLSALLTDTVEDALQEDAVIIASRKVAEISSLHGKVNGSNVVLDVNGWDELKSLNTTYQGLCW